MMRNELGYTQAAMAKTLDVSPRSYQSYEAGKSSIPIEALYQLHQQFEVDTNWILHGAASVRSEHDLAALERFMLEVEDYVKRRGVNIRPEKKYAVICRWYRSLLEGHKKDMADVYTWIELLQE